MVVGKYEGEAMFCKHVIMSQCINGSASLDCDLTSVSYLAHPILFSDTGRLEGLEGALTIGGIKSDRVFPPGN